MSKAQTDTVFLIALALGLLIIAGLYAMSGVHIQPASSGASHVSWSGSSSHASGGVIQNYPTAGLVGKAEELAATTKKFPVFNASHMDEDVEFGNFSGRIFNGLLYGKKDARIIASLQNDSARIEFSVSSTNGYGRLMVMAGKCVLADRKFGTGQHSVEIPQSCVSNETQITLHASSSLWRLWAPTVYDISSLHVYQRRYVDRPARLEFSIPHEIYSSLDRAYLTLMMPFHTGNVSLSVNGRHVGERQSEDEMIYHLPASDFREGTNEITISASEGGYLRGTAELELFHYLDKEKAVEKSFEIGPQEMANLGDGGEIRFFVSKVYKPGGIGISIRNSRGDITMNQYLPLHYGTYAIPITRGNVSSGINTVRIKSVDGSAFEVDSIEVVV